jgi:hypothetical protein
MSSFNLTWVILLILAIILLIVWYNKSFKKEDNTNQPIGGYNESFKKNNNTNQPMYKVTFYLEVKNPKIKEPQYYEIIYDIPINISDEDFIIFKSKVLNKVRKSVDNDYDRKMLEQQVSNQLDNLIEKLRQGRVK